jgi:hypothetical protein
VKRQPTHGAGSNKLNEISGADFIKPAPLNYLSISISNPEAYATISFSVFPALNLGALLALICIVSPV